MPFPWQPVPPVSLFYPPPHFDRTTVPVRRQSSPKPSKLPEFEPEPPVERNFFQPRFGTTPKLTPAGPLFAHHRLAQPPILPLALLTRGFGSDKAY